MNSNRKISCIDPLFRRMSLPPYSWSVLMHVHTSAIAPEELILISRFLCGSRSLSVKLRGLSPQANYTDRATAAVGEVVPTFADRGVLRGQRNGSPRPLISVF
jgi:hypothetical protein